MVKEEVIEKSDGKRNYLGRKINTKRSSYKQTEKIVKSEMREQEKMEFFKPLSRMHKKIAFIRFP